MLKNKSFIIYVLTVVMLFTICHEGNAAPIDKMSVSNYIAKMQNTLNRRDLNEMKNFFQYYTTQDSRYLLTNYYVDPDKTDRIISQEQREMNKDQYINYLNDYLFNSNIMKYYMQFTIDDMQLDTSKNQATIALHYEENIVFNKAINQGQNPIQEYQKTTANCNLLVQVETIDVVLVGMNCIRQTANKLVAEIQKQYR